MNKPTLQAISYLAPNWFGFYQAVTQYLEQSLPIQIQLQQGEYDPLDDPLLLRDQIDLLFICGLPLIRHHQKVPEQFQVLAAPVMRASRYHDSPVYFSDVIVSRESEFICFSNLRDKTFCYNDRGSNSGYNLMRWHLLKQGSAIDFFGNAVQSDSHQRSIQWIVEGQADCAAIDSTVLEQALQDDPTLIHKIRVIDVLGPSPMPPIAAATHLGSTLIQQLRSALLTSDTRLQSAMTTAGIQRYTAVNWQDYEILADIYEAKL